MWLGFDPFRQFIITVDLVTFCASSDLEMVGLDSAPEYPVALLVVTGLWSSLCLGLCLDLGLKCALGHFQGVRSLCTAVSTQCSVLAVTVCHDVKRVRRHAEWMLSILPSLSNSAKPLPAAFATRTATAWRPRDGAMPRCSASDEEGPFYAE